MNENNTSKYYLANERTILCDYARYDYESDKWVYAEDSFFANVINSNDADEISETEARKIVEENGGTNFDKRGKLQ